MAISALAKISGIIKEDEAYYGMLKTEVGFALVSLVAFAIFTHYTNFNPQEMKDINTIWQGFCYYGISTVVLTGGYEIYKFLNTDIENQTIHNL